MRRLPLGLVFVAAVVTRRTEDEAAELFRDALAASGESARRDRHAARARARSPRALRRARRRRA